ncbi:hypothetical protein YC2023_008998 [Brassica napus]
MGFTWGDHQPSWMLRRTPRLSSGGRSLVLVGSSRGSGYQDHQKKKKHKLVSSAVLLFTKAVAAGARGRFTFNTSNNASFDLDNTVSTDAQT